MNDFKKFTMYDESARYEYSDCVSDLPSRVIVNVDGVQNFILHTKDKDYNLDFKRLLRDYGIERHRDF